MSASDNQVPASKQPAPLPANVPTAYRIVVTPLPMEKRVKVDLVFDAPSYAQGQLYATFTLSPREARALTHKLEESCLMLIAPPQAQIAS